MGVRCVISAQNILCHPDFYWAYCWPSGLGLSGRPSDSWARKPHLSEVDARAVYDGSMIEIRAGEWADRPGQPFRRPDPEDCEVVSVSYALTAGLIEPHETDTGVTEWGRTTFVVLDSPANRRWAAQ